MGIEVEVLEKQGRGTNFSETNNYVESLSGPVPSSFARRLK